MQDMQDFDECRQRLTNTDISGVWGSSASLWDAEPQLPVPPE